MQEVSSRGIIILGGHVQALGIVRILGKDGLPSIIIDNTTKNIARHSRYCSAFYKVSDNELLDFLLKLGNQVQHQNWTIFPTNDFHVKILSQNKSILQNHFIVSTDYWSSIEVFYNKRLTYQLANKLQIPIAKTFFPSSIDDLANITINFPCIIKPAVMHDFYKKVKKKVLICKSAAELQRNYQFAMKVIPSEEIMVQEIIEGHGSNQFSVCLLFLNQKTYVALTATRLRQHPIDFGNATTYAETVSLPELIQNAEILLRAANFNGICEVEFKKDNKDGLYKLLEVNTRTWKWHAIANKASTPFLKLYFNYLNGNQITPFTSQSNASFRHGITDIYVQLILLMKGRKEWRRVMRPMEGAVWSVEDFKPWIYEKLYLLNLIKNR